MMPNTDKDTPTAPTDAEIVTAMSTYGGSFASGLGDLWRFADADNRARLKKAFPEYWAQYSELVTLKRRDLRVLASGGEA